MAGRTRLSLTETLQILENCPHLPYPSGTLHQLECSLEELLLVWVNWSEDHSGRGRVTVNETEQEQVPTQKPSEIRANMKEGKHQDGKGTAETRAKSMQASVL